MSGLKDGNFRSYLRRNRLKTLAPILGKANEFIKSEEFERASNIRRVDPEIAKEEKWGGQGKKEAKKEVVHIAKGKEKKENFESYTPLAKPRAQIFAMHKYDDKWQRPQKIFHKGQDRNKWCYFHKDEGHITKDCKDLKKNLKDLIRRGYFT